jgi:ubiquinone/menaquinone biosynthesis C-methylase UbiE
MIAFASQRARAHAELSNVRFLESDGENLALRDASFDAAVSRWGLMLMPEPPRAARSIRRTLKPGARFAAAVWSTPDEVPFIALPQGIAERELGIAPPDADTPGPMRMGRAGLLEECLQSAGFSQIESRIVPLTMTFASPSQYVQFQRDMSGTLKRALESQPADVQARTWALVERSLAPYLAPDGRVVFENRCRLAVARA